MDDTEQPTSDPTMTRIIEGGSSAGSTRRLDAAPSVS